MGFGFFLVPTFQIFLICLHYFYRLHFFALVFEIILFVIFFAGIKIDILVSTWGAGGLPEGEIGPSLDSFFECASLKLSAFD